MTKDNKPQIQEIDDVDFENFSVKRKVISINGKNLPLAIGDRLAITEHDAVKKTVVGISIAEDGRVQYALEWFDTNTGSFMSEQFTMTELRLLNKNQKKYIKDQIGL